MKDAGLRIRLEPGLREEFIQTCHENHVPAAQVLREFMRNYVRSHNDTDLSVELTRSAGNTKASERKSSKAK